MEFWNANLNPITMLGNDKKPINVIAIMKAKKGNSIKPDQLDGFVTSKELRLELGIGTKKIKALFLSIGEQPKYNLGKTYYRIKFLDKIKEILSESKKPIDFDKFISNVELISMFGFTSFKAWKIADDHKLVKNKFKNNVIYYEREKAIEVFSKYQK